MNISNCLTFVSGRVNTWPSKLPGEILDYTLEITDYIDPKTDFVMPTSVQVAPSGPDELQLSNHYVTTREADGQLHTYLTVTLSGGQARDYTIMFLVPMTDGRVFQFIVNINVLKILSGVSVHAPASYDFGTAVMSVGGSGNPVFSYTGKATTPFWFVVTPDQGMYIDGNLTYDGPTIEYVGAATQNEITDLSIDNAVNYIGRLFPQPALWPLGFNLTSTSLLTFSAPKMKIWMGGLAPTFSVLNTFSMPALEHMNGVFAPTFNLLTRMSFPALVSMSGNFSPNVPLLLDFSLGSSLLAFNGDFTMAASLTQESVDGILKSLVDLDGTGETTEFHNRLVDLSGGSNAPPSSTGLTYKSTLIGRGCSVVTN